jgi:hypothetical protein
MMFLFVPPGITLWNPARDRSEKAEHEAHTPIAGGVDSNDDKHVDLRESSARIMLEWPPAKPLFRPALSFNRLGF